MRPQSHFILSNDSSVAKSVPFNNILIWHLALPYARDNQQELNMKFLGYTKALNPLTGKDVHGFFLFQIDDVMATRDVLNKNPFMTAGLTIVNSLSCIIQDITQLNTVENGMVNGGAIAMVGVHNTSQCLHVSFKINSTDFTHLQIDETPCSSQIKIDDKQPMTPSSNGIIQILIGSDKEGEFKVGDVDVALDQLIKVSLRNIASLADDERERLATHYPEHRSTIIPKMLVSLTDFEYSF